MKNILKIACLVLAIVFVSCDAVDDSRFQANRTSGWVEFNSSQMFMLNQDASVEIPIQYNVPINREDVIVGYTVELVDGTNPGVTTGSFETTVFADTRDVSIPYEFLASDDGNYTVRFSITSVSNPDVIVGLDGDNPIVLDVSVVRDFDGLGLGPDCGPENNNFVTSIDRTETPGEYLVSSAWGDNYVAALTGNPAFEGQFVYEAILTVTGDLDEDGNTVISMVGTNPATFPGTDLGLDEEDEPVEPCGSVSFDPLTGTMNYSLSQNLFNGDFIVDVTLTPLASE